MGIRFAKPGFEYTEESIRKVLNVEYLSNPKYLVHNLYVFEWESDYLARTRAGYWYEVEIKISLSDFKNDFKKKEKHETLRTGKHRDGWGNRIDGLRPNYFAYCVPEPLVSKVDPLVPEYAGLFGVSEYGHLVRHKGVPRLHDQKITDDQLKLTEKFYYNWAEQVRKNREHEAIVKEFRREISFLKAEFKAVTGYDISESY